MNERTQFIESVRDFLQARKEIAAVRMPALWGPDRVGNGHEAIFQLEAAGVQSGSDLRIVSVPYLRAFHIMIVFEGACVSRLDFNDAPHTNTIHAAQLGLPGVVSDRHFHRWSINERFIEGVGSLVRLKHAEELPASIRTFNASLRWFCDEVNIDLPHDHRIDPPELLL